MAQETLLTAMSPGPLLLVPHRFPFFISSPTIHPTSMSS